MPDKVLDVVIAIVGLPIFMVAFYLWFKTVRHFIGSLINFNWKRWWGLFIPVYIFIPYFFTEKGNYHREKCLSYGGWFLALCLTPIATHEVFIK